MWAGVIAGTGSGLAGAAVSGFVTLRKVRSDLKAEYDKDLRTKRLEQYLEIWPQFAPLATTKAEELRNEDLEEFSRALRDWYFAKGGIYLSASAMDVYNIIQREISRVTHADHQPTQRDLARVRFFGSSLRTRMTEDLGTRRQPLVFRRSWLADKWRKKVLYRRAGRAVAEGGYAGPKPPPDQDVP